MLACTEIKIYMLFFIYGNIPWFGYWLFEYWFSGFWKILFSIERLRARLTRYYLLLFTSCTLRALLRHQLKKIKGKTSHKYSILSYFIEDAVCKVQISRKLHGLTNSDTFVGSCTITLLKIITWSHR